MKQGDTQVVHIAGIPVGQAVVESVKDNQVTLVIPAQRVVMGMRTELTDGEAAPKDTTGTETIIEGAERSAAVGVESPTQTVGNETVVGNVNIPEAVVQPPAVRTVDDSAVEDNTPEAIEFDSAAGKTVVDAQQHTESVQIKSPVTITSADGKTFTLPPGTTMDDLMEPAANE